MLAPVESDQAGKTGEPAGPVGDERGEAADARIMHQTDFDHPVQDVKIDIAAREHQHDALARQLRAASPARKAASGAAPAPSTTRFSSSMRRRIAVASAASSTVTTLLPGSRATANERAPTRDTASPSARVG